MNEKQIMIRIEAQIAHLRPPKDDNDRMIRRQADMKLQSIAAQFEKPLKQILGMLATKPI